MELFTSGTFGLGTALIKLLAPVVSFKIWNLLVVFLLWPPATLCPYSMVALLPSKRLTECP
jgi:hypothetical protein